MTCTRPQAESQKDPLTRGRRPHMTHLRHRPDRNPAAQQSPAVFLLFRIWGKALSSETAHGHQAAGPSVFAQDDGRRTERATMELGRMVPRVGAGPDAA